ncbi:MAG: PEP-CTERM sorting domain-containing protein [Planctomycetes bacterium]|nr:PEP-CTERM sorting domain-containing protein [Planctomycetota bacterium]
MGLRKSILAASVAALFTAASANAAIVINEIWADDGAGDTNEFIELFGPGGADLTGLSVIIIDNDNGGNTGSSTYRRVNQQWDLSGSMPGDGYFVLGAGPDVAGVTDFAISVGNLQNGSQTYALVQTSDIAYDAVDTDELTQASIDAIALNSDIIATWNEDIGDLFDFGPIISQDFGVDAASRLPNGVDTDTAGDWTTFNTFDLVIELGDANDFFGTPGGSNVPEPATLVLLAMGGVALLRRRS